MTMTREEAQREMACGGCVYYVPIEEGYGCCHYERKVYNKAVDHFCSDHARIVEPGFDSSVPIYEGVHEDGTDN